MTAPMMEEDQSHMTEKILNLTLEIIYLLTGESFPPLKSGDHVTITVPPCDSLKPERPNMEKVLEATKKMMELLTGEGGRSSEDKKDSSKNVKTKKRKTFTSPGSSKRNPPERCPRPLYSRDPTQEDLSVPHHDSRDPTQEDLTVPHHDQAEDLIIIKVEDEGEETYEGDGQQYTEEAGTMRTFIGEDGTTRTVMEEDTPTGHAMEKPSKDRLTLSPGCKMEDEDITVECAGKETMSSAMDGGLHSVGGAWSPSDSEPPRPAGGGAGIQGRRNNPKGGDVVGSDPSAPAHQKPRRAKKLHSCSECGECFIHKSKLVVHYRSHTGEKPYSCPECGKWFSLKSCLSRHQRLHTGEKPHACTECGKSFIRKGDLVIHQRSHTGERPYSCTECYKCFSDKTGLTKHRRLHTGEKPYSCPQCGKCFSEKSHLNAHQKSHTGVKPHSCPECGKGFSRRSHLTEHQLYHSQEKLFSCPECGKCYPRKSRLVKHQNSHVGKSRIPDLGAEKAFPKECH